MVVLMLYITFYVTFDICFNYKIEFSYNERLTRSIINYTVDSLFLLDVFINFITAYDDIYSGKLEIRMTKIAKNYISSWFLLDLLCVIPFDLLTDYFVIDNSYNLKLFRLARLPRIWKITKIIRLIKLSKMIGKNNLFKKAGLNNG